MQKTMLKPSYKLLSFLVLLVISSCTSLRRKVGAEAENEQYKCTHDANCKDKCDADHCKEKCLGLPSKCFNGLCACPFDPGHSAVRVISNSTCSGDGDCTKFCPIVCTIKSCIDSKCSCGCHG